MGSSKISGGLLIVSCIVFGLLLAVEVFSSSTLSNYKYVLYIGMVVGLCFMVAGVFFMFKADKPSE